MEYKKSIDCFADLEDLCWSGAVDRLKKVSELGAEEEFFDYVVEMLADSEPTDTDINDFVWFECDDWLEEHEMEKVRFGDVLGIRYDILDTFNALTGYELCVNYADNKVNILDLQKHEEEYVFEEDITLNELIDIWTDKAKNYFNEEYVENMGKLANEYDKEYAKIYTRLCELITEYKY